MHRYTLASSRQRHKQELQTLHRQGAPTPTPISHLIFHPQPHNNSHLLGSQSGLVLLRRQFGINMSNNDYRQPSIRCQTYGFSELELSTCQVLGLHNKKEQPDSQKGCACVNKKTNKKRWKRILCEVSNDYIFLSDYSVPQKDATDFAKSAKTTYFCLTTQYSRKTPLT